MSCARDEVRKRILRRRALLPSEIIVPEDVLEEDAVAVQQEHDSPGRPEERQSVADLDLYSATSHAEAAFTPSSRNVDDIDLSDSEDPSRHLQSALLEQRGQEDISPAKPGPGAKGASKTPSPRRTNKVSTPGATPTRSGRSRTVRSSRSPGTGVSPSPLRSRALPSPRTPRSTGTPRRTPAYHERSQASSSRTPRQSAAPVRTPTTGSSTSSRSSRATPITGTPRSPRAVLRTPDPFPLTQYQRQIERLRQMKKKDLRKSMMNDMDRTLLDHMRSHDLPKHVLPYFLRSRKCRLVDFSKEEKERVALRNLFHLIVKNPGKEKTRYVQCKYCSTILLEESSKRRHLLCCLKRGRKLKIFDQFFL